MLALSNAYKISNVKLRGFVCKTNIASNTAFRGFGTPQGMFFSETMIRHIADHLKKDHVKVAEINLIKTGDTMMYGQIIENCTLTRCWKEVLDSSKFHERRLQIEQFNQ